MKEEKTELEWLEKWMIKGAKNQKEIIGCIDLVFEFLEDRELFTEKGKILNEDFWKKYVLMGRK